MDKYNSKDFVTVNNKVLERQTKLIWELQKLIILDGGYSTVMKMIDLLDKEFTRINYGKSI